MTDRLPARPRRALLVFGLALLLVSAGCNLPGGPDASAGPSSPSTSASTVTSTPSSTTAAVSTTPAPTSTPTSTSTPTVPPADAPAPAITVRNGTLPVDPGRVYVQVRAVLGVPAPAPRAVALWNRSDLAAATGDPPVPPVWTLFGVTDAPPRTEDVAIENGVTSPFGTIRLYLPPRAPPNASRADRAATLLAHEFVHYVQFQNRRLVALNRRLGRTTDDRFVRRALLEGVAVVATDAFVARFRGDRYPNGALYERVAALYPPGSRQRYGNLAYRAGAAYVRARYDDPADAWAVFESPPQTSAAVLSPDIDPVTRPLSVRVVTTTTETETETETETKTETATTTAAPTAAATTRSMSGSAPSPRPVETAVVSAARDTLGAAFLRTALRNGVSERRARRVAAGWANDSLLRLDRAEGQNVSAVWAIRFANASAAARGAAAMAALLDARGNRTTAGWRIDDTVVGLVHREGVVVVLAGTESLATAPVTVTDGRVRVTLPAR